MNPLKTNFHHSIPLLRLRSLQRVIRRILCIVSLVLISAIPAKSEIIFEGTPSEQQFDIRYGAAKSDLGFEVDTTDVEREWCPFLFTLPTRVSFSAGKRYRVAFDYKILKLKSENSCFYHSLNLEGDETSNRGWGVFRGKANETGRKQFVATLPGSDGYRLVIGSVNGGAIIIKNLKIEEVPPPKLDPGFIYQSPMEPDERLVVSGNARILDGKLRVDTTAAGKEWSRHVNTMPQEVVLNPGHNYKLSFTYKVDRMKGDGSRLNASVSVHGSPSKHQFWESWAANPGESDRKEFTFAVTEPQSEVVLGDYSGVAVQYEDLRIEDLGKIQ